MINANMRYYDYYTIGELDEYGQEKMSKKVAGRVKMSIYQTAQNTTNTVLYADADFIGLTMDKNVKDSFVIVYGDIRLKVRQINAQGRLTQVFLKKVG